MGHLFSNEFQNKPSFSSLRSIGRRLSAFQQPAAASLFITFMVFWVSSAHIILTRKIERPWASAFLSCYLGERLRGWCCIESALLLFVSLFLLFCCSTAPWLSFAPRLMSLSFFITVSGKFVFCAPPVSTPFRLSPNPINSNPWKNVIVPLQLRFEMNGN